MQLRTCRKEEATLSTLTPAYRITTLQYVSTLNVVFRKKKNCYFFHILLSLSLNFQEKTKAVRAIAQQQRIHHQLSHLEMTKPNRSVSPGSIPHATMDLSSATTTPHELSTLV